MIWKTDNSFHTFVFTADALWEALENEHFSRREACEHPQARYLFRYLSNPQIHASMMLVENHYTDRDYLDDFSSYHVQCNTHYQKECQRIHFFSLWEKEQRWLLEDFQKAVSEMILTGNADRLPKESYLGFVVVRPLPVAIIGRTLLKHYPKDPINEERGKGKRERRFCKVENGEVNLMGVTLKVDSLGFMEQDHTLAACATVALWTCFQKCADIFKTPILSPTKITSLANEYLQTTRVLPSEGLSVEQAVSAIHKNHLEAEVIKVNNETYLKSIIYAYMEFALPVILVLDRENGEDLHAIAITGYSINKERDGEFEKETTKGVENYIAFSSSRIVSFYAHDDNIGPYTKFDIRELEENRPPKRPDIPRLEAPFALRRMPQAKGQGEDESCPEIPELDKPARFVPITVVIPLYHKIRVDVQDIHNWINPLSYRVLLNKEVKFLANEEEKKLLEWDIYLTDPKKWKADLGDLLKENPTLLENMRKKPNPEYIWRATLKHNKKLMMDLLADATDIGGKVSPFYDVIFYDGRLEGALRNSFSREKRDKGEKLVDRQLDSFFFNTFEKTPTKPMRPK